MATLSYTKTCYVANRDLTEIFQITGYRGSQYPGESHALPGPRIPRGETPSIASFVMAHGIRLRRF